MTGCGLALATGRTHLSLLVWDLEPFEFELEVFLEMVPFQLAVGYGDLVALAVLNDRFLVDASRAWHAVRSALVLRDEVGAFWGVGVMMMSVVRGGLALVKIRTGRKWQGRCGPAIPLC